MDIVQTFIQKAQQDPARLVYPEASDPRILEAVVKVRDLGIAHPILIGNEDEIRAQAQGLDLSGIEIIDSKTDSNLDVYSAAYAAKRDLREPLPENWCVNPSLLAE